MVCNLESAFMIKLLGKIGASWGCSSVVERSLRM